MIGIYKITNLINNHCYIGQSRQIEKRWSNHKVTAFNPNDKAYEYPLYRAIRKYGINNFDFQVIEECTIESLNNRENYWINFYLPEYNQTCGGDYQTVGQKLTYEQVQEIQNILIKDKEGLISHKDLAEKYNVSADTIRDINVGRTWFSEELNYPLHLSKYDSRNGKKFYCECCGKQISQNSNKCIDCYRKSQNEALQQRVSREELKELIRNESFTDIGKKFHVTINAVKKWCIKYNLPSKKKDINAYSNEEWLDI